MPSKQTTLVVLFFYLVKQAPESKANLTYEAVGAQYGIGPAGDANIDAEGGGEVN